MTRVLWMFGAISAAILSGVAEASDERWIAILFGLMCGICFCGLMIAVRRAQEQ